MDNDDAVYDELEAEVRGLMARHDALATENKRLKRALQTALGWREVDLPEGRRAERAIEFMENTISTALGGSNAN